MQDLQEEEVTELKNDFPQQRKVTEEEKSSSVKELEQLLPRVFHHFCTECQQQFQTAVWDLKENKLTNIEQYCKLQMRDTQDPAQRLKTSPQVMQDLLEKKVTELKNDFKKQLTVTEVETSSYVKEFEQQLQKVVYDFCCNYQFLFESALKESKLKDFEQYCEQQMRETQDPAQRLKTSPRAMQDLLEKKVTELKNDFKKQLTVTEGETPSYVKELDQRLRKVVHDFCCNYQLLFESALKESKLKDFEQYCEQQMQDTQGMTQRCKTSPRAMLGLLEKKVTELKNDFKNQLTVTEEEKSSYVKELDQRLQRVIYNFYIGHQKLFGSNVQEFKKHLLNDFEQQCKQKKGSFLLFLWTVWPFTDSVQTRLEKEAENILSDFEHCLCDDSPEKESVIAELREAMWRLT